MTKYFSGHAYFHKFFTISKHLCSLSTQKTSGTERLVRSHQNLYTASLFVFCRKSYMHLRRKWSLCSFLCSSFRNSGDLSVSQQSFKTSTSISIQNKIAIEFFSCDGQKSCRNGSAQEQIRVDLCLSRKVLCSIVYGWLYHVCSKRMSAIKSFCTMRTSRAKQHQNGGWIVNEALRTWLTYPSLPVDDFASRPRSQIIFRGAGSATFPSLFSKGR